jgi:hypothetical protein
MKNFLLLLIVWTVSVLAAYHYLVVEPYCQPKREVWVVNLDAQEKRIKELALKALAAGEALNDQRLDEITAQVEGEVRKRIEALPKGSLVIDNKGVVISGETGRF